MERISLKTGRRGLALMAAAVAASAALASSASADVYSVPNQFFDTAGYYMPYHNITRVYVHDQAGGNQSCEDAWNGGWVQDNAWCVGGGGATYHDFNGLVTRQGWLGANVNSESMDGHEDY